MNVYTVICLGNTQKIKHDLFALIMSTTGNVVYPSSLILHTIIQCFCAILLIVGATKVSEGNDASVLEVIFHVSDNTPILKGKPAQLIMLYSP